MKKVTQFLALFIGISFFNCNNMMKKTTSPVSNLDADFPVSEKLEFKLFKKYDILEKGSCVIDDSILWHFERGEHDFGSCYNLNTGEKLSIIIPRGKATHELIELRAFEMIGDSVQLYTSQDTIKTFAKKDIIDDTPMEERKFSVTTNPDSIFVSQMIKLPNSSVLATIRPTLFEVEKGIRNKINKKSVVLFNNNEAKSYETIKYDSFDVRKAKNRELAANDLIKWAYAQGFIEIKNNDTAVFSVNDQFILYTFDINSGNVINEKRYTRIQRNGEEMSFITTNDRYQSIGLIKSNDTYILCGVDGYFSEEDKKTRRRKKAIFVFDWNLNPIKKFDLPDRKKGYYTISNNCSSVYFCEYNEDGLMLYKADLTI
ncbi:hypothetical protein [uncultured Sanguibacteroides sp.]|uniref:hypothetical protein n=1 Tax=uncultured Sanguibacteroides sp. TaxID=1635151 RepID=UPI0025E18717|nr:hypothetical protein [uncultured Sanguibacteroides sp.]